MVNIQEFFQEKKEEIPDEEVPVEEEDYPAGELFQGTEQVPYVANCLPVLVQQHCPKYLEGHIL